MCSRMMARGCRQSCRKSSLATKVLRPVVFWVMLFGGWQSWREPRCLMGLVQGCVPMDVRCLNAAVFVAAIAAPALPCARCAIARRSVYRSDPLVYGDLAGRLYAEVLRCRWIASPAWQTREQRLGSQAHSRFGMWLPHAAL